jgi:hypothetical protein
VSLEFALATRRTLEDLLRARVPRLRASVSLELEDVRLDPDGDHLVVILRVRDARAKYGFRLPSREVSAPEEWTPEEWADVLLQGIVEEVEAVDRGLPPPREHGITWVG